MPTVPQIADCRDLFGGAIRAVVPAEFTDVSCLRQVPDNQEVFAHADTDRSLLFELLQLEKDVATASSCPAHFHWDVLARDYASIVYGTHHVSKFHDSDEHANVVLVSVACIRLPRASTDVLIVFNDPIRIHCESSSARQGAVVDRPEMHDLSLRSTILQAAVTSFHVINWSLFL
jgi:Ran-interacting Mog1 protein